VALGGRGVLIFGPAGAGKSALALQLMAFGCDLVSDDRTAVVAQAGSVLAAAPARIRGLIEARGVGILAADAVAAARVALLVDLGQTETERLPPWHSRKLLGVDLPVVHRIESTHFPAAILQYLKAGRVE
jgi:HPr kinase/phosphorylase